MILADFDRVIELTLSNLEQDCLVRPELYRKSGEDFEPQVRDAVDAALTTLGITDHVDYTPGGHGFPDIVIVGEDGNKYGIEVKSSTGTGNSWKINGNSVLGSTRVPGVTKNVIVFGKVRGKSSIFRAKEYEKCIANVVVTHSPRYLIDLDIEDGDSFFDKSNLTYRDISEAEQPIKLITDYFLGIGQTAWWLSESTPAAIQMFGKLPNRRQSDLIGYGFAHFPEIFSSSGTKFYRFMSWLVSENSIIDPALRDRFTAGGKADVSLKCYIYHKLPRIFTNLHNYRQEVLNELRDSDPAILYANWGQQPNEDYDIRIDQWASLVASALPEMEDFDYSNKKQLVRDILNDPIE